MMLFLVKYHIYKNNCYAAIPPLFSRTEMSLSCFITVPEAEGPAGEEPGVYTCLLALLQGVDPDSELGHASAQPHATAHPLETICPIVHRFNFCFSKQGKFISST